MKLSVMVLMFLGLFGVLYFMNRMEKAAIEESLTAEELEQYRASQKTLWQRLRRKKNGQEKNI